MTELVERFVPVLDIKLPIHQIVRDNGADRPEFDMIL